MYSYFFRVITLLCILLYGNSYSIYDVTKIEINIFSSDNKTYNLPVNIIDDSFKSKIIGLPYGMTSIVVKGVSSDNKKLFEGIWKGDINNIDHDIVINMLDLEINPTLIGEMPPYFNSINIIPSKINPGEVTRIIAYADDLNYEDSNSLSYEVLGLDKYSGDINYINTNGKKLEFTYSSHINESIGIRNGVIKVSDSKYYSSSPISFTIDTIGSLDASIITSHKPKINFLKTDKTHIKFGDFAIISANFLDQDNSAINFEWSISSIIGDCLITDLIGQKNGITTFNDLTIQYKPLVSQERKCQINLYISDNTELNATGTLYLETNTQIINHSPILIFGYQSSYSAEENSTITFIVRGEELDGNDLQFKWYTEGNVGILLHSYELYQNYNLEKPFIKTSNNELTSSGEEGKIICEIIDSYNSKYIQEFNIIKNNRRRLDNINSYPIYFRVRDGEIQILSDNIFSVNNITTISSDKGSTNNNIIYLNPTCNCNHNYNNTDNLDNTTNPLLIAVLVILSIFILLSIIGIIVYIRRQKDKIVPTQSNNSTIQSNNPTIQSKHSPTSNIHSNLNKLKKLPKISAENRRSLEKEKINRQRKEFIKRQNNIPAHATIQISELMKESHLPANKVKSIVEKFEQKNS